MTERVLLPSSVRPSHYKLELSPDLVAFEFDCKEDINIAVFDVSVKEITLHAKEINVQEVTFRSLNADSPSRSLESISYNLKLHTVTFAFDDELPVGDAVLSIKFKGILNSDMAGFYRSSYADANGTKKIMASTQFEALDARR
jgi:aminopeptidase N